MLNGNGPISEPLHIIIVGAGIGGLSAAIALRQQGHRITLLEQSRFNKEVGAAIHVTPNCYGLLERFGLRVEDIEGVELVGVDYYGSNGEQIAGIDLWKGSKRWQHPWMLTHRVNLHNALKDIAINVYGTIPKTSTRVTDIDCERGVVICENGEKYEADLIVGADGVHSVARDFICDRKVLPHGTGKSAFRFLIASESLRKDPNASFFMDDGRFKSINEPIKKLVGYPCNNNTLMNCLFVVPKTEVETLSADSNQGHMEHLLHVAKDFGPGTQAILSHIDPEWLTVWELLDMEPLPTWIKGRLILLGDAAHPFLPWLGQGGAMAIEDAASIAALLPLGTRVGELKERLELYEKCRYERATRLQQATRSAGADAKDEDPGYLMRTQEAMAYSHAHDEWDNSSQVLREHIWARSQSTTRVMPVGFGPLMANENDRLSSRKVQATIRFKTSRTKAQNLLPTSSFRFAAQDTLVYATWQYSQTIGATQSSRCGLYLHGVRYKKSNGEEVHGSFAVIEFDASVESVMNGRERYGLPRMHCKIIDNHNADHRCVQLNANGRTFAEFEWSDLKKAGNDTDSHSSLQNIHDIGDTLTYKHIPSVDSSEVDLAYPVLIQDRHRSETNGYKDGETNGYKDGETNGYKDGEINGYKDDTTSRKILFANKTHISFHERGVMKVNSLHNIVARLSELPVYGVADASIVEDDSCDNQLQAKKIEESYTADAGYPSK